MKREQLLDEITDGKLYSSNDLAKLACDDCAGCSACCRDMEALILDPYDLTQLKDGLQTNFDQLLQSRIHLEPVDGLLLPIMNTSGELDHCSFLNEEGRCSIHSFRPGICRLFPLGRYYHDDSFSYILQVNECKKEDRRKVKIKKWLNIPNLKQYEKYTLDWHHFLSEIEEQITHISSEQHRILHIYLLRNFYQTDFDSKHFYEEFYDRLTRARIELGLA